MENSKISVVVPTYNNEETINIAIKSIFSQAIDDIELIIVDDGSCYDVEPLIRNSWPDKKITFIRQENKGPGAARNTGIKKATGDLIAFLDADDEWMPEHLEKCLNFLTKGSFDWVATGYNYRYPDNHCVYRTFSEDSDQYDRKTGRVQLLKHGLFDIASGCVWTGSLLFKRECLNILQGFDETIWIGEDWDLFFRAEEAGFSCGFLDEPTAYYALNNSSLTKNNKRDGLRDYLRLAKKHYKILKKTHSEMRESYADFVWSIARGYFIQKRVLTALRYCLYSQYISINFTRLGNMIKISYKIFRENNGDNDSSND
jgi:glycosyltransferase involved in cell wall biosynthesis